MLVSHRAVRAAGVPGVPHLGGGQRGHGHLRAARQRGAQPFSLHAQRHLGEAAEAAGGAHKEVPRRLHEVSVGSGGRNESRGVKDGAPLFRVLVS